MIRLMSDYRSLQYRIVFLGFVSVLREFTCSVQRIRDASALFRPELYFTHGEE